MKTTCLALVLATACFARPIVPVADKTFEFHSGFWMNLDHFLREQASANQAPLAVAPAWTAALEYYRRNFVQHQQPSDDAVHLNDRLSELEAAKSLRNSGLDPELVAVLESAAPVYRSRWWPAHDRGNRAWIKAVAPLLSKYSATLKLDLAKAYATTWPSTPIRVDVCEYASPNGAYTTIDPSHITISSVNSSYQGEAALEMLFHEGSHTIFSNVQQALRTEARAQNKLYRRSDFWHAVLFYTAGTVVERHVEGYSQYAIKNGVFARGWPGVPEILDRDWKPYLSGEINMTTAIRRMIADYGVDPPAAKTTAP